MPARPAPAPAPRRPPAASAAAAVAAAVALGAAPLGAAPVAAQPAPGWDVRVPERVDIALGDAGVLAIAIAVDRGLAVSRDAPVIVELQAPGLALKRPRLGRADAIDPDADAPRFAVPLRPPAAGEHAVTVRVRFWLCGARTCRPLDVRREARVVVAPPPAPAPPSAPPPARSPAPAGARQPGAAPGIRAR